MSDSQSDAMKGTQVFTGRPAPLDIEESKEPIEQPPELPPEEHEAIMADFAKREYQKYMEAARDMNPQLVSSLGAGLMGVPQTHNRTTGFIPFQQIATTASDGIESLYALDMHGMLWLYSHRTRDWHMLGNPTLKRAQAEMRRLGEEILDGELEDGEADAESAEPNEAGKGNGAGDQEQ